MRNLLWSSTSRLGGCGCYSQMIWPAAFTVYCAVRLQGRTVHAVGSKSKTGRRTSRSGQDLHRTTLCARFAPFFTASNDFSDVRLHAFSQHSFWQLLGEQHAVLCMAASSG
jgi:hypothetical protein